MGVGVDLKLRTIWNVTSDVVELRHGPGSSRVQLHITTKTKLTSLTRDDIHII